MAAFRYLKIQDPEPVEEDSVRTWAQSIPARYFLQLLEAERLLIMHQHSYLPSSPDLQLRGRLEGIDHCIRIVERMRGTQE